MWSQTMAGWCGHRPRKSRIGKIEGMPQLSHNPLSRADGRASVRLLAGHVKRNVLITYLPSAPCQSQLLLRERRVGCDVMVGL